MLLILLVQDQALRTTTHPRRRGTWIFAEQSLIWNIIWTLLIYMFVLRQIMLCEVKSLIFDMSDLESYTQFSHFCTRLVFWLSIAM